MGGAASEPYCQPSNLESSTAELSKCKSRRNRSYDCVFCSIMRKPDTKPERDLTKTGNCKMIRSDYLKRSAFEHEIVGNDRCRKQISFTLCVS
eukprot:300739-Amphidinium_carterae.1